MGAIEYPAPNATFSNHCDHLDGWVILYSIGCKPNFYVSKGSQNIEKKYVDFNSGCVLIFDSTTKANIMHEIAGIKSKTCPDQLSEQVPHLKNCRISLQFRIIKK